MTLYDYFASLWRTAVPAIVGFAATQFLRLGVEINDEMAVSALVMGFAIAYYALFRAAEARLGKGWGWLLGLAAPPSYREDLTRVTLPVRLPAPHAAGDDVGDGAK